MLNWTFVFIDLKSQVVWGKQMGCCNYFLLLPSQALREFLSLVKSSGVAVCDLGVVQQKRMSQIPHVCSGVIKPSHSKSFRVSGKQVLAGLVIQLVCAFLCCVPAASPLQVSVSLTGTSEHTTWLHPCCCVYSTAYCNISTVLKNGDKNASGSGWVYNPLKHPCCGAGKVQERGGQGS